MIRKRWERLRETVSRGVERARRAMRKHDDDLDHALFDILENRRDTPEYWGALAAVMVGLLLPTFAVLAPACDPGAAPPGGERKAETDARIAVADTIAGFLEAFLNGNGEAVRSYLSETCRPEDVDEIASGAELLGRLKDATGGAEYRVDIDGNLLTIAHTGFGRIEATFPFNDAVHLFLNGQPFPSEALFADIGMATFELRGEYGLWSLTDCREMASQVRHVRQTFDEWFNTR